MTIYNHDSTARNKRMAEYMNGWIVTAAVASCDTWPGIPEEQVGVWLLKIDSTDYWDLRRHPTAELSIIMPRPEYRARHDEAWELYGGAIALTADEAAGYPVWTRTNENQQ